MRIVLATLLVAASVVPVAGASDLTCTTPSGGLCSFRCDRLDLLFVEAVGLDPEGHAACAGLTAMCATGPPQCFGRTGVLTTYAAEGTCRAGPGSIATCGAAGYVEPASLVPQKECVATTGAPCDFDCAPGEALRISATSAPGTGVSGAARCGGRMATCTGVGGCEARANNYVTTVASGTCSVYGEDASARCWVERIFP